MPGLNGFIGEFLILLGAFHSAFISNWYTIFAATGVIFAAVYLLWMYQRVIFGNVTNPENRGLKDVSKRELAVLIPVLVFIVWIGIAPNSFLNMSAAKTKQIVTVMQTFVGHSFVSTQGIGAP